MSFKRLTYILVPLVVILAAAAGVWYFVSPAKKVPVQIPGKISGITTYPGDEGVPAQLVCAQSVKDGKIVKCTSTPEQFNQQTSKFELTLPAGTYWVYASLENPTDLGLTDAGQAYYTQWVVCGMTYACKDHAKIDIKVEPGQNISGIKPADWQ